MKNCPLSKNPLSLTKNLDELWRMIPLLRIIQITLVMRDRFHKCEEAILTKNSLLLIFLPFILFACKSFSPNESDLVVSVPVGNEGLQARYFGASTIFISDGQKAIMIDGFFTRLGLEKQLFRKLKTRPKFVDKALRLGHINGIDLLLVAHSHFDHVLDSDYVANKYSARLMGSARTQRLIKTVRETNPDLDHNIEVEKILDREEIDIGNFTVIPFRSEHGKKSKLAELGEKLFLSATYSSNLYGKKGDVYTFYIAHELANILIIPSASADTLQDYPKNVDVVFLGIGLLGSVSEHDIITYWQKAVVATGAKVVIPIHYDALYKPLDDSIDAVPQFIDDIEGTISLLKRLAEGSPKNKVVIKFAIPNIAFSLVP